MIENQGCLGAWCCGCIGMDASLSLKGWIQQTLLEHYEYTQKITADE